MTLMCFALLGAVCGRAFRWQGLLLIVSILAVAIGVEGALNRVPLASVLANAALMLVIVEGMFVASSLFWGRGTRLLFYWKA